jgi:pimeloyl-ACP methyl ester carboxylesterase
MSSTINRYVNLPERGKTLVREVEGPPGAPTVVLLHGLGATGQLNWGPSYRALSEHFRVLCLDHRGHGRGIRTRRFSLEDCADDVAAVAAELGVERLIAAGYSMGGPIAKLVWRRHPRLVSGLVLCATARHFTPPQIGIAARRFLNVVSGVARIVPAVVHRQMLDRLLAQMEQPEARARVTDELVGHDPASIIQAAAAVASFSSHSWINEIDVPTAVIITTLDDVVPPSRQRKLAASIKDAVVFEIEGNHVACVAAADRFVPALVRACLHVHERAQTRPEVDRFETDSLSDSRRG